MKNIKFEDLPKATEITLEKLSQIERELAELKQYFQPKEPCDLMTRQDTAAFLKINITTLHNWTRNGKLNAYGIGGRVYYKRKEIETSLIKIK